ncbi:MAG TPA: hypothetical protein VKL61_08900 [Candidatus Polarisedimenticolia bacterium]|nr:hypothetical protein [Candidatus Polarisedimenticolia bacterium]
MAGARWVQTEILRQNPSLKVKVYAVWFNMVWSDSRSFWPSRAMNDPRVTNLWDRKKIVGRWYASQIDGADPDAVVWDTYYLYGPEARWDGAPPAAISHGGPIVEVRDDLKQNLLSLPH